ncbi:hypothetical protein K439DRAFT_1306992, partial [Ramaria rubella]
LGFQPPKYRPNLADYAVYTATCSDFLMQPHAHAALLQGGIIWCLAIDALGYIPTVGGPSDEVYQYGHCFKSDNSNLWDDNLTTVEMDLICGVYYVYTGQHNQYSNLSWWPKQSVWMCTGLNIGYWSSGCEIWFQKRLDDIHQGRADLRTAAEWRRALKFERATARIATSNERGAAMFL